MKGTVITVIIAVILVVVIGVGVYLKLTREPETSQIIVGGIDSPTARLGNLDKGSFLCGTTTSIALTAQSGEMWVYFTNVSTGTATIAPVSSTSPTDESDVTILKGINLAPVGVDANSTGTFSGKTYFDSGESDINFANFNWACVASVTGTEVGYIRAY